MSGVKPFTNSHYLATQLPSYLATYHLPSYLATCLPACLPACLHTYLPTYIQINYLSQDFLYCDLFKSENTFFNTKKNSLQACSLLKYTFTGFQRKVYLHSYSYDIGKFHPGKLSISYLLFQLPVIHSKDPLL